MTGAPGSVRGVKVIEGESKEAQVSCPGQDRRIASQPDLLDRALLRPREFSQFVGPWLHRAVRAGRRTEFFEGFIYLWVTFNAWLGQVVRDRKRVENDWYLVAAAGCDRRLSEIFKNLLLGDPLFRQCAEDFQELWPVFKVRALSDLRLRPWNGPHESRADYRQQCFEADLAVSGWRPSCVSEHQDGSEYDPRLVLLDWSHSLSAIYMVRCNLFHGGKTFQSSGDSLFVEYAFRLL